MKAIIALLASYVTAFIVTYGHAYHQLGSDFAGERIIGSFMSAMFWPLYWSVQVWK